MFVRSAHSTVDIVRPLAHEANLGDIFGVGERETGLQLSQEENCHIFEMPYNLNDEVSCFRLRVERFLDEIIKLWRLLFGCREFVFISGVDVAFLKHRYGFACVGIVRFMKKDKAAILVP